MTRDQANLLSEALAGSYEGDHDIAAGACLQAAVELDFVQQGIANGISSELLLRETLIGIAARLRAAASLAQAIELARDGVNQTLEAAQ
jgi:hypothetical protein